MVSEAISPYLKNHRLVVFPQVVGKDVCVHERLPALAQDVHSLFQELYFNPGHVVLLHLLHFLLDRGIQLVLKLERLHVVHVAVAIEKVALQG
jgi:hypothetical protein